MYSQPLIDLKLWIFKFIRSDSDQFAVCVEGYRKKDFDERELENWRSTAIKKRANSQTLLTVSGSKYVLHGVIDQDSAYALGYPKTLIERFKDGFPYEWQELLRDYYDNVVKLKMLNTSERFYSVLLGGVFLDLSRRSRGEGHRTSAFGSVLGELENTTDKPLSSLGSNAKRGKRLVIKEKIVEEDENISKSNDKLSVVKSSNTCTNSSGGLSTAFGTPLATSSRDNTKQKIAPIRVHPSDEVACNSKKGRDREISIVDKSLDNSLFKMPLLPLQRHRKKPVQLYNWTIRFSAVDLGQSKIFPNFAFVIIGFRPDQNLDWSTSCIIAVEGSRLVRTATNDYELMGPINTVLAAQQGFPKEFVAQFLTGFPKDWRRILSLFFNTYIEPHLPPKQSLTISEINDESKMQSDDSDSDRDSNDSDDDSIMDENIYCRKQSPARRHNSKKSVQYRVGEPYNIEKGKRKNPKSVQSRKPVVPTKRVKPERELAEVESPDLSLLRTTRSGRTVKPRLANWIGQRIIYNVRGTPIKTVGITTDSVYSTSVSDASALSLSRGTILPKTIKNKNRKANISNTNTRKAHLVAYSDSESTSSDDEEDEDAGYDRVTPVTPFYGRRGRHVSRVILSSPDEEKERKTAKKHRKTHKEKNCARKKASPKLKQKPKKDTSSKNKKEKVKEEEKESNAEEAEPIVSFSDVESDNGVVDNKKGENATAEVITQKAKKTKPKWTINDNTRLKIAVQAMHPQSEEDWEKVATTVRRTAEECRKQAVEVLKLKVTSDTNGNVDASQEVADALKKAKVGTLAYQIQADRFTRQYLKGGDGSDFFEESVSAAGTSTRKFPTMPSVTTFDSDDSLLSVLRTPTPRATRQNNRRRKLICIPEARSPDSPRQSSSNDSGVPFKFDHDDAYREQQLRYVHKMLKLKKHCNVSRANTTKSSVSMNRNYRLNLPNLNNEQDDSDKESDEDEYFEEEVD